MINTVLKTIIGTLLVQLTLVVLVFGTVNPEGDLWGNIFPTVTPVSRAQKIRLLAAWEKRAPVEGLIIGSSRSMELDPAAFEKATGHRYFNFSVTAAMLEDVRAILTLVERRYTRPRELVLDIDPVMLSDHYLPSELTDNWVMAPILEHRQPTVRWKIEHAGRLLRKSLTPTYAREVGMSILAEIRNANAVREFRPDGRVEYRARDKAIAEGRYDRDGRMQRCIKVMSDTLLETHEFDRTSPRRLALLDSVLARASAEGIRVTLWMPPSHPMLDSTFAKFPVAEAWLGDLPKQVGAVAAKHGASFIDLSHLQNFHGDPNDFYDCVHYGPANAARITEVLLANRPTSPVN